MSTAIPDTVFGTLLTFLGRLDDYRVPYALASIRPQAIMVQFALPGERWEVEFMVDGGVEVERFHSDGTIADESAFPDLWRCLAGESN